MREQRRVLTGTVTSDKMEKTVVVQVERSTRHRLYGKVVRSHKKYVAHDENNQCQIGDTVLIRESRPLSKTKRWVVEQILSREALPGE
ncbi:MAG: 30S ribosomal protein S17 [Anaerolineae bacterium]|jgi:small subunit ribosomal protein S17